VHFDAAYIKHPSLDRYTKTIDYTQIFKDFEMSNEDICKRAVVICPFEMDPEEMQTRKREDVLFYEENSLKFDNMTGVGLPEPNNQYTPPITILVPSSKGSNSSF
jgi:hypothetical protein